MKYEMSVPLLNNNDTEMEVVEWYCDDKAFVEKGTVIASLESSKAVTDIESEHTGYILRASKAGETTKVGAPLAFFYSSVDEMEGAKKRTPEIKCSTHSDNVTLVEKVKKGHKSSLKRKEQGTSKEKNSERSFPFTRFSQAALAYIKRHGLETEDFQGMGLVTVETIEDKVLKKEEEVSPTPIGSLSVEESIPVQKKIEADHQEEYNTRKLSQAKRQEIHSLTQGQSGGINSSLTVQFYSANIRKKLSDLGLPHSQILPLVVYEFVQLLLKSPEFIAYYDNDHIFYYNKIHLGIAMDLGEGLKVPVIQNADQYSPTELFKKITDCAIRYTEHRLTSDMLRGGTCTITDLSNENILYFQPLLTEKQSTILGIGGDSKLEGYPMSLTLVFDHRVLTGRSVGKFLDTLKKQLIYYEAFLSDKQSSSNRTKEQKRVPSATQMRPLSKVIDAITKIFSQCTSIDNADPHMRLEDYGLDSAQIVRITIELKKVFPDISETLLFEHKSLQSIAKALSQSDQVTSINKPTAVDRDSTQAASLPQKIDIEAETIRPSFTTSVSSIDYTSKEKEGIAIIGISGRYPQARTMEALWEVFKSGKSCFTKVPGNRWDAAHFFDPTGKAKDKSFSEHGGFLEDIECFDAGFFNISPRDAELMDPQQRLFLEVVWEMLEDGGYTRSTLDRNTGVFAGLIANDYTLYTNEAALEGNSAYRWADYYQVPNRISYFLDLIGPSIAIDTGCSASGAALHLACQSLKNGECATAIAGGANLFLHPSRFVQYSQMQIISKDSQCRPFGANANGTMYGEGVGALLLKPLSKAEKEGDHIYGVILATAINAGGRTNGFTVPNPQAHTDLVTRTLENAQIDARTISYVEAHGTGTALGDPIEMRGLTDAFRGNSKMSQDKQYCSIGSLKANIGHSESVAAIAGVTKVLLQMKYQKLAPSLNAETLNPLIPFSDTPFYVQQELKEWERPMVECDGQAKIFPRRAGISSFGAGGSNAHIIIEEYEPKDEICRLDIPDSYLVILSAKDKVALKERVLQLHTFIDERTIEIDQYVLSQITYTLQIGREAMRERLAFIISDKKDLLKKLEAWLNETVDLKEVFSGNTKSAIPNHLLESEEGCHFIEGILKKGDLKQIAQLWISGIKIDWPLMYGAKLPQRISLPTYPFARESYWITDSQIKTEPAKNKKLKPTEGTLHIFKPSFKDKPLPEKNVHITDKVIVIFDNDEDLYNELGRTLINKKNAGNTFILVKPDESYKKVSDFGYTINPESKQDYLMLVKALKDEGLIPDTFVYDWMKNDLEINESDIKASLMTNFYSLLYLSQALMQSKFKNNVAFVCLGRVEKDKGQPLFNGLAGFIKTLKLENPKYTGKVVEIVEEGKMSIEKSIPSIADILLDELAHKEQNDIEVCYRGGIRRTKTLIDHRLSNNKATLPIKRQGIYLITGGVGGLGLIFSRYLVEQFEAKVILLGRSELTDEKADKLKSIGANGGEAFYIKTDVSNSSTLKETLEGIRKKYHHINGVIHSAGIIRDAFILRKQSKDADAVLAAKIYGTLFLDELTREDPLDFFIMFSSTTAVTGNVGQCDYGYANSFMDSYSVLRQRLFKANKRQGKTLAINWPLWRDGGMHVDEQTEGLMVQAGLHVLEIDQGIQAFEEGIISDSLQIVVAPGLKPKLAELFAINKTPLPSLDEPETEESIISDPVFKAVQDHLTHIFADEIKFDPSKIDPNDPLEFYGIDSIVIQRLNLRLESLVGAVSKTLFFEYQSLSELTHYFLDEKREKILAAIKVDEALHCKSVCTVKDAKELPEPQKIDKSKEALFEKILYQLKMIFAKEIKIAVDKIDIEEPFESYGVDSILIQKMNAELEKSFGSLSKTLFYECQNLSDLADYLIDQDTHPAIENASIDKDERATQVFEKEIDTTGTALSNHQHYKSSPLEKRLQLSTARNKPSFHEKNRNHEDIAIIGMAGRYPQAKNLKEYWDNLCTRKELVQEVPIERWDWRKYQDPLEKGVTEGKSYNRWGTFLEDFDQFDPLFFNISPREAETMDPQERIFIQTAWETFEDAGYTRRSLAEYAHQRGREIGVFAGITKNSYPLHGPEEWLKGNTTIPGCLYWSLANRVSYLMDLHGPSMPIDTACSSSLVAIHEACESIKSGECGMALVGGVNLYLHPSTYIGLCQMRMLSHDGKCRSFGKGGNGFVPGEGVGALLLKPLSVAEEDNDHIYGVIRSTAVNHDGKTNGYTVPNPKAQKNLIRQALDKAAINARTISYIEAHGTGTELGDPIEISGLTQAYREDTLDKQYCAIGSVKSNIGHLESGAGISGMIKVLLQMQHKQLAPSLNAEELNPNIDFKNSPFKIQKSLEEWRRPVLIENRVKKEYPRRSGISSFGAGGVNAHVIIEEYLDNRDSLEKNVSSATGNRDHLIIFSAKNEDSLKKLVEIFIHYLEGIERKNTEGYNLCHLAYTLQIGRESMAERLALIIDSYSVLLDKLRSWVKGAKTINRVYQSKVSPKKALQQAYKTNSKDITSAKHPIDTQEIERLAKSWLSGTIINWHSLYEEVSPKRLSLPTYPFSMERYWIPLKKCVAVKTVEETDLQNEAKEGNLSNIYFYRSIWEQDNSKNRTKDHASKEKATVLILSEKIFDERLINEVLKSFDHLEIVQVEIGICWDDTDRKRYEINANGADDYQRLFNSLRERDLFPEFIIYNIANKRENSPREEHLKTIYNIVQGIKVVDETTIKKIVISYRENGKKNYPWLEASGGFIRSMRLLGLPLSKVCFSENAHALQNDLAYLFNELYSEDSTPFYEVRYKENLRFLRKTHPLQVIKEKSTTLIHKGVYLITGGAGGLGKIFAQYLCEQYAAKVILIGRSARNHQHALLEKDLQELGGDAIYIQCNVCDETQMTAILSKIKDKHQHLNGVIHAAGLEGKGKIDTKSWASFKETLDVKTRGTMILDDTTQNESLDFFVTFSSTAAIIGDFGQCDYATANRFVDEYTTLRKEKVRCKERFGKSISINWPLWRDGGMGSDSDQQSTQFYLQSSGLDYLETDQGVNAFETALSNDDGQYIIMAGKQPQIENILGIKQKGNDETVKKLDEEVTPISPQNHDDLLAQNDEKNLLSHYLNETLKELIVIVGRIDKSKVEDTKSFSEYGFDSLYLKGLASWIESKYKIRITPIVFFEHSTLAKLRAFLLKKYKSILTSYYSDKIQSTTIHSPQINHSKKEISAQSQIHKPTQNVSENTEPVAVVGMSGIFPGASNLYDFWKHLAAGKNLITEIPSQRWDWRKYYGDPSENKSKTNSKWGGFINDFDKFDPLFFGISPREAELMDPQHRLFLETIWHTIEDAGHRASSLSGKKIGVFVGCQFHEYETMLGTQMKAMEAQSATGNVQAILANRISYLLNLCGPSEAINTACSGSLIAVHRALRAVQTGEVESAFAGGVSLALTPDTFIATSQLGVLSPQGRCKTFDRSANGYVKGEGVGALWLKRLSQAEADNDWIHGLIIGSAENHGGKANSLTAPNPEAQAALITEAYMQAKVNTETIGYIETHGTGTELGDPIEIEGLKEGFARTLKLQNKEQRRKHYCGLGTVKTNIGHLEPASGIAGIIKVLLSLKHKKLPAILHLNEVNPYIELEESPFYIVKEQQNWDALKDDEGNLLPRRAGVSSFGFGGSNAHILLEEYCSNQSATSDDFIQEQEYLIILSAKNRERLNDLAENLYHYIDDSDNRKNICLRDMAYTLQVGRESMAERLAIVVKTIDALKATLKDFVSGKDHSAHSFYGSVGAEQKDWMPLVEGRSGKMFIDTIMEDKDMAKLGRLWVNGLNINWELLYQGQTSQRITLPTYPFARERYWIPQDSNTVQETVPYRDESLNTGSPELIYFTPEYVTYSLTLNSGSKISEPILIIDRNGMLKDHLEILLGNNPNQVPTLLLVQFAKTYREVNDTTYEINPRKKSDWAQLVQDLSRKNLIPRAVIHYCSEPKSTTSDHDSLIGESFFSIFYLVQELMHQKIKEAVKIICCYSHLLTTKNRYYAALSGFLKTLYLENPQYKGKLLELVHDSKATHPEQTKKSSEIILNELTDREYNHSIRYKDGMRYIKKWDQQYATKAHKKVHLGANKCYVITGGLGGLGLIFARFFTEKYQAKVILLGRSEWTPDKTKQIEYIDPTGDKITYIKCDVSNKDQTEVAVNHIKEKYGSINGIIHSAGVTRDAFILKKEYKKVDAVFKSKLNSALILDTVTSDQPLDFFVMFSSITAVLGNIGQSDYAYANAFIDEYAQLRESWVKQGRRKGKTLSINWPLWKEGGMHIDSQSEKSMIKHGLYHLEKTEGIRAFEYGLSNDSSQLIVAKGIKEKVESLFSSSHIQHEEPLQKTKAYKEYNENSLLEKVLIFLRKIFAQEVKLPSQKIKVKEPLGNYGLDSLLILRMNARLETLLGPISKTLFFEYRTLLEIANFFIRQYPQKIISILSEDEAAEHNAPKESNKKDNLFELKPTPSITNSSAPIAISHTSNYLEVMEPIAIIGLNGRYPGAKTLAAYWENLKAGKATITVIPPERWSWETYHDPSTDTVTPGKSYSKWGGFLEDYDQFDPLFFGIAPREAEIMDPQERLFLETVWSALEDGGYTRESLEEYANKQRKGIGVFVGVTKNSYQLHGPEEWKKGNKTMPNSLFWSIANRVSYTLNLNGPSMTIDTACSSSLTAICEACESLNRGQTSMAIAGGVNLYLHPSTYVGLCQMRMLSRDGKCRSFGLGGNGFVPGEGVGALLLKPLSLAQQDNDHIYGLIRGTATNHDGRTNGYTVPNPRAQATLVREALSKADINAQTLSYMEAHGTGTELGDPIEVTGLMQAYNEDTQMKQFCALGSVKANIGHLEAAAGIAAVTKVILQMKEKMLVPSLHVDALNPNIDFEETPFKIQDTLEEWKQPTIYNGTENLTYPRRAGVSSFGAGGANAHVVLEEYEDKTLDIPVQVNDSKKTKAKYLILLSAKNEEQLKVVVKNLIDYLKIIDNKNISKNTLGNIAYTLAQGREAMTERLALVVNSMADLIENLMLWLNGDGKKKNIYQGNIKVIQSRGDSIEPLLEKMITYQESDKLTNENDWHDLAGEWVKGASVDWKNFYQKENSKRIPLPTYPFIKKRYWFPILQDSQKPFVDKTDHQNAHSSLLHPVLDENDSTLKEQRFSTRLNKDLFFLRDHKVNEKWVLPGVAYLEMARRVGEISSERPVKQIKNVVWIQPINVGDKSKTVHVTIHRNRIGTVYKVFTLDDQGRQIKHAQGELVYDLDHIVPQENKKSIDLTLIRQRCHIEKSVDECYLWFLSQGLNYGPSFRPIQKLQINNDETLAYMEIPDVLGKDNDEYALHPSLMDGALQCVAGLNTFVIGEQSSAKNNSGINGKHSHQLSERTSNIADQPSLPFALERLDIFKPLPHSCYTYVKRQKSAIDDSPSEKYEIQIVDKKGEIYVSMTGLSFRTLTTSSQRNEDSQNNSVLECLQLLASGDLNRSEAERLITIR